MIDVDDMLNGVLLFISEYYKTHDLYKIRDEILNIWQLLLRIIMSKNPSRINEEGFIEFKLDRKKWVSTPWRCELSRDDIKRIRIERRCWNKLTSEQKREKIIKTDRENNNIDYMELYKLGKHYFYGSTTMKLYGEDIKKYQEKGLNYIKEAAEGENVQAQYLLGSLYYMDSIVRSERDKAIYWFKKAADKGSAKAADKLGDLYRLYDKEEALKWYELSIKLGSSRSIEKVKKLKDD